MMTTTNCSRCPEIIDHSKIEICSSCQEAFCVDCMAGHECVRGEAAGALRVQPVYPSDAPKTEPLPAEANS